MTTTPPPQQQQNKPWSELDLQALQIYSLRLKELKGFPSSLFRRGYYWVPSKGRGAWYIFWWECGSIERTTLVRLSRRLSQEIDRET